MRQQQFTGTFGGNTGTNILNPSQGRDPFLESTPAPKPQNATRTGRTFAGTVSSRLPRASNTTTDFGQVNLPAGREAFGRLGTRAATEDVNSANAAADVANKYADEQTGFISEANRRAGLYNEAVGNLRNETYYFDKPQRAVDTFDTNSEWRYNDTPVNDLFSQYLESLGSIDDSLLSNDTRAFRDTAADYNPFVASPDYNMYQFQGNLVDRLVQDGSMDANWDWEGENKSYAFGRDQEAIARQSVVSPLEQFGINDPLSIDIPSNLPDVSIAQRDGLRVRPVYDPWTGTVKNAEASSPYVASHGNAPAKQALQMFAPDAPYVQQGYAGRFSNGPSGSVAGNPDIDPTKEQAQDLRLSKQLLPDIVNSRVLAPGDREAFTGQASYNPVGIVQGTPEVELLKGFPTAQGVQNPSRLKAASELNAAEQQRLGAPRGYSVPQNYWTANGQGSYYGGGTFSPSDIGNETDDSYFFKNYGWVKKSQVTPLY